MSQQYAPDPQQGAYQQPVYQNRPQGTVDHSSQTVDDGGAYAQSERQSYVDPAGNRVENRETVYEDPNQSRANARYWITTIVYFLLGVLEVILGLRFLFRFLGANPNNSFISFLYSLSHVFVGPFNGIFNDQALGTRSVFEISTLIAMLLYALIAWGLVSLGRVIFAPNVPGRQTVSSTRRSRY